MNKHLIMGIILVLITAIGIYGFYLYSEKYPSTDNAYVGANLVNIAPKVGGYVMGVYVKNNQLVHKGDILITIDPKDYSLKLDQTQQELITAQQQQENTSQQIKIAELALNKARSDYRLSQIMAKRYSNLYYKRAGSLQDMQRYQNQLVASQQAVKQAYSNIEQAKINYNQAKTKISQTNINIKNAQNYLKYTIITAPVTGYVSSFNLQVGELVSTGQKLFGLVDNSNWWIDANFKETQLKKIKIGQPVSVKLDIYNHQYQGVVETISYASGNTFSLLPAENATGNWVKVTQRFTVRIHLEDNPNFPLRVGASSEVKVDTTEHNTLTNK